MVRRTIGSLKRYALNLVDTPAVVLLYHRVTHLPADPQLLSVAPEHFYEQIALVKRKYNLLRVDEFTHLLTSRKKMPKHAVVITFDDGYSDNFLEAIPILESLDSQALFYVTTSNIDTPYELWWDELERLFLEEGKRPAELKITAGASLLHLPTIHAKQKLNAYNALHPLLKFMYPSERNKIIGELQLWAGVAKEGRPSHRLMTTAELAKMGQSKAAVIGAHTHNHPALSALSFTSQSEEISRSKKILEKVLQQKMEHFSYPFGGKKDYNKDSIAVCQAEGFKLVCSNYYGQVHRWTDPLQVPRILVRNWNKAVFANQLTKFFTR